MARPSRSGFAFPWRRDEPCQCGSGQAFGACCLSADGRPVQAIASLQPPGPVTGFGHPGCYLAPSCNCSPKLSREHYISRTLISGPQLRVRGFPWQKSEVLFCSPDSLTDKILCQRHNSALSPLDNHAGLAFRAIGEAADYVDQRPLTRRIHYGIISGDALELWAMKTLAGLHASGIPFFAGGKAFRDYPTPVARLARGLVADPPFSLLTLASPLDRGAHEVRTVRRLVWADPRRGRAQACGPDGPHQGSGPQFLSRYR